MTIKPKNISNKEYYLNLIVSGVVIFAILFMAGAI